jgi:hypothetical protein
MKEIGAVKRLKETAKDGAEGNLQQEWDRVAEIIKPQVRLGKPTRVPSVSGPPALVSCRIRCNITPSILKSLFKTAGYTFRYQKGRHEFSYAYNEQLQWIIMDNLSIAVLCTY